MEALEILKNRKQILDCKIKERIENSYNKQYEDDNQITKVILDELNLLDKAIKELEELSNRSCNNCCKYDKRTQKCSSGVSTYWGNDIDIKDFYCSEWEN